jgi:hypothetical protein
MQISHKKIYGDLIGISHSVEHAIGTYVCLLIMSLILDITAIILVIITVIEGIIHYHIDWIKGKYGNSDSSTSLFWNHLGLDQMLHQLTYIILAYILT